ncbi:MAG: HNH endonuclease [Dehalococcoidales bacterium]|nr:HNH endonuclease [Dehalococcoidales bacterium]
MILELEHIIPLSKGGTDELDNLTTSCFECNRGKGVSLLDTILKDRDIHDETILLAEREFQLAEYNYVKKNIRDRENKEIEELRNYFADQFRDYERNYAIAEFPDTIVRQCLKIMSYVDIFELVDVAVDITSRDTKGDYHTVAAAKYLTAILRNKLREKKDSATTTGNSEK